MKPQRRRVVLWLGLILMLVVILTSIVGCGCPTPSEDFGINHSSFGTLTIENQTEQSLTIFYQGREIGKPEPGGIITTTYAVYYLEGTIAAQNTQGELVLLQVFTHDTLQNMGNFVYKAVIPSDIPLQGPATINASMENTTDIDLIISVNENQLGEAGPFESITKAMPC